MKQRLSIMANISDIVKQISGNKELLAQISKADPAQADSRSQAPVLRIYNYQIDFMS